MRRLGVGHIYGPASLLLCVCVDAWWRIGGGGVGARGAHRVEHVSVREGLARLLVDFEPSIKRQHGRQLPEKRPVRACAQRRPPAPDPAAPRLVECTRMRSHGRHVAHVLARHHYVVVVQKGVKVTPRRQLRLQIDEQLHKPVTIPMHA
jgi:hypothetical protein